MWVRFVALIAAATLAFAAPRAEAQAPPSATAVEALLRDMSAWMGDYYAVSQSSPLDIDGYLAVVDRFDEEEITEAEAVAGLTAWRDRSLATNADARRRAGLLRAPPSMAQLGARGGNLDTIMRASYDGLSILLENQRVLIERLSEMGLSGIQRSTGLRDVRVRAVIESQIQTLTDAQRRIRVSAAALAEDHPNRFIFNASLGFYDGLMAMARNELSRLDGGGDAPAVARTLRASAGAMRTDLDRSSVLAERLRETARWQHTPETERIAAVLVRLIETYPELIGNYRLLADGLDRAAAKIEGGGEVVDSWADLEEEVEAPLQEIARLDRERAAMVGQLSPSL